LDDNIKKTLKSIETTKRKLSKLKSELREKCTHDDIEYKNHCDDDWAIPNWYSDSYNCKTCGAYASTPSYCSAKKHPLIVNKTFETLYKLYWSNICKSQYRLDKFNEYYIVED
jgi:hypothetical protein